MVIDPEKAKALYDAGQIREDQFLAMVGEEPVAEVPEEPTTEPSPEPVPAPVPTPEEQVAVNEPAPEEPQTIMEQRAAAVQEQPVEEGLPPTAGSPGSQEDGVSVADQVPQRVVNQEAERAMSALDRLDAAYVEEKAAVQEAAAAGKAQAAAEAAYNDEAFKQAEQQRVELEARIVEQQKEIDVQKELLEKEMQELKETTVDPDRYWKNKTDFQKIMLAIGIGLSAADGKAQERTMNMIDRAIARDIDAQKAELNKRAKIVDQRGNLISRLSQTFNDEVLREKAAYGMLLENTKLQLNSIAGRYQSAVVQANANALSAQIEQKRAKVQAEFEQRAGEIARRNAVLGGDQVSPELLSEDDRKRFVPVVNGLALTEQDAKEVKSSIESYQSAMGILTELRKLREENGVETLDTQARRKASSLQKQFILEIKNMAKTGALDQGSVEVLGEILANDPLGAKGIVGVGIGERVGNAIMGDRVMTQIDEAERMIRDKIKASVSSRMSQVSQAGLDRLSSTEDLNSELGATERKKRSK